ncbi:hypothetical protein SAMN03159371_04306 [Variovorax sp. NFACC28]|nr:hypothetical protein SAMN03159371_04306 [Variovorax sp. NFACC28]SEG94114.1 hypothetical protein SAMN03159365_06026 [Variovorax sp. NFACC29]
MVATGFGIAGPGPGLGPAADLLFFASPKKSRQKKGDPTVCVPSLRCGQPAVLDVGGGPQNSLRSNSCGPYPSYVCAPRRSQKGVGDRAGHRCARPSEQPGLAFASLGHALRPRNCNGPLAPFQAQQARSACCALGAEQSDGPHVSPPLWLRRGAQRFADQGSQLSERSEFCETPRNASTAGCPVAQRRGRRQWGRLSFAYFSLAKQRKVGRPPGRVPAPESNLKTRPGWGYTSRPRPP